MRRIRTGNVPPSKQQSKVVRNKLFEDTVEETWEEEKDQREWSRNERGNGFRKLKRISELVIDESGDKKDKDSNREERARIMQVGKAWAEIWLMVVEMKKRRESCKQKRHGPKQMLTRK